MAAGGNGVLLFFALVSAGLAGVPTASAAILQANANAGAQTSFDGNISSVDLINQGRPSFQSVVATGTPAFPASGSNDGTATQTSGLTFWNGNFPAGHDLTYTLTGSPSGYDITMIRSIYGWQDSRYRHAAQQWVVSVATVSNPSFQTLHSVVYAPFPANDGAAGSTQVTLTDNTGLIATGVTAIRFHINPYASTGSPGYTGELGVIREFDVFGAATPVPEAGHLFAASALLLAVMGIVRRRTQSSNSAVNR